MFRTTASLLLLATLSCGGGGGGTPPVSGGNPNSGTDPCTPGVTIPYNDPPTTVVANPHFATDILPVLQASCGSASDAANCHGAAAPYSRIHWGPERTAQQIYADLTDPAATRAPVGWMDVNPSNPAKSWVREKVLPADGCNPRPAQGATPQGAKMPLGGLLRSTTLQTLRNWFEQPQGPVF
ncbi:MAG: hypothetical protein HY823_08310 [Acidobacteria bacterium]|nr:hypothetical protein [Acidobacteriota bacterium]